MDRRAFPLSRVDPSPRAARKSEWLRSALAHHHCPDPGVENEIVVLATGIDQYLQEVFHHLAYPNRDDTVTAEDFGALCAVLGLNGAGGRTSKAKDGTGDGEKDEEDEEFRDVCSRLPCQLSFKDFHSRLCGYFRVRSARRDTGDCAGRLPLTEDTELVERQIRLRWPRVRRRKNVSFDLPGDQSGPVPSKSGDRETDEVSALRELVEDLRSALQGSDARCLALEVALQRARSCTLPSPSSCTSTVSSPTTSITFVQGKLVPTHRIKGQCGGAGAGRAKRAVRSQDIRDTLLRELKLIRSSRDGQLGEAIKFNERLEKELQWAYQGVRKLQGAESALRKENNHIRKRAEEAREALSLGLQRVRLIQEQAQAVPQLQSRISQLETELHQYRSGCSCLLDSSCQQTYPFRAEDTCNRTDADCLQRAVEGRAASDEEEEDRGPREEGEWCRLEVKKQISQLHDCGKGCRNQTFHHLSQSHLHDKNLISTPKDSGGSPGWRGPNQEQQERSRGLEKEKQRPEEEEDQTRLEEKEKTRLSLLEEKLTAALTLLLQLRNKNMSRRVLGKIVMDALDVCSRAGDGRSRVLQVADALCLHLSSSDLLGDGGDNGGGGRDSREKLLVTSSGRQTSSPNPLLISC
ncbi:EF-hand and coiled-coil domain-containing protein 1 isoform X1 [Hippoglossus hippoglossus]|uniref:EF-hand and coiled-coil domain-containing protein 1 isoform X1 n=1 Tax=Hippoglossus hippoglossus TaxID=8267 RepID=UPI00148D5BEB|nr:EF-hand and coiled-coil domain-containing protein 1 isoform X1 [Hippoglossus hippoglossus]